MSLPPVNSAAGGVNQIPSTPQYHTYIPATSYFAPTMAIIIIVLFAAFFFMGFFALYIRKCASAPSDTGRQRPGGASQARSKSRGLAKEVVEALPVAHFKDLGGKGDVDCPVCLSHFEAEDSLRKLPHCNHVFHLDCIDLWFVSHSTCPLCRASLLPDGSDTKDKADGAAEQENGVMEVPREVVVSVDVAAEVLVVTGLARTPSELPVEEESAAPGPVITRGDEIDSARDSLRRNSLSFKRAVRGVAALEMAASPLRVEKPPKLPTPTNLSIQRSSSLGTDSKSLRNYFINSEGTLRGINFHVGTASKQGISSAEIQSAVVSNAHVSGSPLAKPQDHWVTIDLEGETSRSKPPLPRSSLPTGTARVISRPEKWSFNNLRGVFPLSRSSSDLMQQDQHPPV